MCKDCEKIYKRYHTHGWQHELFPKAGTQHGVAWCNKETKSNLTIVEPDTTV